MAIYVYVHMYIFQSIGFYNFYHHEDADLLTKNLN